MNRAGIVFMHGKKAGRIYLEGDEYVFTYDGDYLANGESPPISVTMPKRSVPYRSKTLFSFFDGLIPEGWLLNIAQSKWNLHGQDRFSLLLTVCRDCIGAVHVEHETEP